MSSSWTRPACIPQRGQVSRIALRLGISTGATNPVTAGIVAEGNLIVLFWGFPDLSGFLWFLQTFGDNDYKFESVFQF